MMIDTRDYVATATTPSMSEKKRKFQSEALLKIRNEEEFLKMESQEMNLNIIFNAFKKLVLVDPSYSLDEKELERMKNLNFYNQNRSLIEGEYFSKYLVIAEGKIKAVGNSLNDVKDAASDAKHRLVFKVEQEDKRVTLRWPMRSAGKLAL